MLRGAAKNHADVTWLWTLPTIRNCSPHCTTESGPPALRCGLALAAKAFAIPRAMTAWWLTILRASKAQSPTHSPRNWDWSVAHCHPALRREPASARGVLPHSGQRGRQRRHCAIRARQSSRSTTSPMRTPRWNACVSSNARPASSSSMPIPAALPSQPRCVMHTSLRIAPTPLRPLAASSPSTGRLIRHGKAHPRSSVRKVLWCRTHDGAAEVLATRPKSACCSRAPCSRPAARARAAQRWRRRAGAGARRRSIDVDALACVTRRQPTAQELATLPLRGGCASSSNPMPSSSHAMKPPLA